MNNAVNSYKKCPECDSAAHLEVRNYDEMWRDGDVYCGKCNVYVRMYDAG